MSAAPLRVAIAGSGISGLAAAHALHGQSLEWSGSSLNSVFAQRGNLSNWKFLRMLADIVRFNRITTGLAASGADSAPAMLQPLGDFLRVHKFSDEFRDWYFLPMMGCIWSCPTEQMLQFPVSTMIRLCHNHGLLQITNRPQWWTVKGGARHDVEKIVSQIGDNALAWLDALLLREGAELRADKVFHVSPFCTLAGGYRFRFLQSSQCGLNQTVARIDYDDDSGPLLQTSVSGTLEPVTAASLRQAVWRYPAMTLGVVARIHWQAFRLWRKQVPFIRKPAPPKPFVTR